MADLCYYGDFTTRYHDAMSNYRNGANQTWLGKAADYYEAKYDELLGYLQILGSYINELEGSRGRLEALL
ncbi:MAG: hypothetical protein SPK50_07395 [Mobiluncus porci]|uniref:Uncharacterized protein n=1 Tax=Mobiluncus porci TaxID=2652278 RepID=A0A7K0K133_9ACTO|nr:MULTISPECIES: hypothetical protein [Mobiluncus]MCI6583528.1 hypothetical protein [Mobiluncus sp.]MDD7540906.1 hypothetical protein [Mobiluncus porci]MDY5748935.1 hypothetical protein [Mobiluncus porci]MST49129.1 hypothetical protein [Mobiluncus porci]